MKTKEKKVWEGPQLIVESVDNTLGGGNPSTTEDTFSHT